MNEPDSHEYEVTSLRTGYGAERSGAARPPARAASGNASQWSQASRRRPRTPLAPGQRRLVTSLLTTAGVLLAVLIVLLASQSGLRASLGALVHPPTPTPPPLAFGANFFLVEHEVPWGVLKVDGKQQNILDVSQYSTNSTTPGATTFWLSRGWHGVEYIAAPFPTLRCTVSVPVDRRDTCPIASLDQNAQVKGLGAARVLDLRATPDHLPADQLAALTGAVAKLISIKTAPVPVPAGEQYLTENSVVTAAQTLQATLFREPWNAPSGIPGWNCTFLCPPQSGSASNPGTWQLTALVRQGFTYATPGGQAVIPSAPLSYSPAGPNSTGAGEDQLQILASWHGGWQVALASPHDPLPTCAAASSELSNAKGFGAVGPGVPQYNQLKPVSAGDPADGCVLGLQQVDPASGKSIGQPIYLLYRFGLLLVTDDAGHQLLPGLPFATPRERTIAQQIIAQAH